MRIPALYPIWLVFDLDNGHAPNKNYVWWFTTRQHARDHIKWQKRKKYSASLSQPVKVYREAIK